MDLKASAQPVPPRDLGGCALGLETGLEGEGAAANAHGAFNYGGPLTVPLAAIRGANEGALFLGVFIVPNGASKHVKRVGVGTAWINRQFYFYNAHGAFYHGVPLAGEFAKVSRCNDGAYFLRFIVAPKRTCGDVYCKC